MKNKLRKIISGWFLLLVLVGSFGQLAFPQKVQAQSCEWEVFDVNGSSIPAFCADGFANEEQLRQHTIYASCPQCVTRARQFLESIFGVPEQGFPLSSNLFNVGGNISEDGTKVCVGGYLDPDVINAVDYKSKLASRMVGVPCAVTVGGLTIAAGASGVGAWTIPIFVAGGAGCLAAAEELLQEENQMVAPIHMRLEDPSGTTICEETFTYEYQFLEELTGNEEEEEIEPYKICDVNLAHNPTALANCRTCYEQEGIWTAIGCIKNDPVGMMATLITIGIGIGGGIALLIILVAAFTLTISQGDVKKTGEAREQLTAAVIGLIFIIFSVTILQFIGADILKIPGFGTS